MLFRCPHDLLAFEPHGAGVRCPLGHAFDRAKEGYLHLLVAGRKAPATPPGDSTAMLRARRTFLDAGHYDPVAQAVTDHLREGIARRGDVLDAGCGEGFYLGRAIQRLPGVRGSGIDIAKDGVRMAARRYPGAEWAVASSYRLPVADVTVDAVLSVFAPRPFEEFARVLRPDGVIVVASPGPEHLAGLTDLIYGRHRPHDQRPHTDAAAPDVVERTHVRYDLSLAGSTATDLLQMTPMWWSASDERRRDLLAIDRLDTVVDVVVITHRPH